MPRLISGIQPSGNLHLGNYLGAIKQFVELQNDYEVSLFVADLHAITVPQDPAELRQKTIEVARIYLAAGIDPERVTLFVQSQISGHTQLGWILNTITRNSDLTKMTQFKDKSGLDIDGEIEILIDFTRHFKFFFSEDFPGLMLDDEKRIKGKYIQGLSQLKEKFNSIGMGLFDYPVLMAADILLYDADVVPVGEDQKQHIELTRDLAERFNKRFGETFVVPKPLITKEGARIMGLDDPTKKMSKSASSEYNYIALADDADTVRRKIMKAVTDSGSEVVYTDEKPALKNLLNIYSLLTDKKPEEIADKYNGKGPDSAKASTGKYADFKKDLAEVVVNFLTPFQKRMEELSDEVVLEVLKKGRERMKPLAVAKMQQVYEKVGFIPY